MILNTCESIHDKTEEDETELQINSYLSFQFNMNGNCYAFGHFLWGRHMTIGCSTELGCITHRTQLSHREGLDG